MATRPTDVTVRRRRYQRLKAADDFAKAFRAFHGQAVCNQTQAQLDYLMQLHFKWMRLSGKDCYEIPAGYPKQG